MVVQSVSPGCRRADSSPSPGEPKPPTPTETGRRPPPTDAGKALFTDVAADVGLNFHHFIGAVGEFYFPEIMAGGCALFDYDNDGDLDVYLIQGAILKPGASRSDLVFSASTPWPPTNRLFRNDLTKTPDGTRRLTFVDVTAQSGTGDEGYGMGCAVGDYDNDGHLDLFVTNYGANVLYRNNADGTFSDVTAKAGVGDPPAAGWSTSATFVDYDGDGFLDLFVVNYVAATIENNQVCNPFGQRDYCNPNVFRPLSDILYHNNGDGTFENVTKKAGIDAAFGSGLGVVAAEFNGDGLVDIYVANDGDENQLWINGGDGTFEDTGLFSGTAVNADGQPEAGMGVAAGDIDQDGDMDIFVTHLSGQTNTMYRNTGGGFFSDTTFEMGLGFASRPSTGFGTDWFDYDNDGFDDLFCANGAVRLEDRVADKPFPYAQRNQLFHSEQGQRFVDVTDRAGPALSLAEVSRGAAFGDVDNDGDVDILVANANGPVRLLRNDNDSRNHWLSVSLRSDDGNRFGFGARVTLIRPDGTRCTKRVHADGSYCSSSDLRVHFGIGDATAVQAIEVRWPDQSTESWYDISSDQHVTLTKGQGGAKPAG